MALSKESADALRECLRILAPRHAPEERRIMARNVEQYIAEGKWLPAFTVEHVAALYYPRDQVHEESLRARILEAIRAGELVPAAGAGKLFASDLAGWPDCPRVPSDSPLRYWLQASMHEPSTNHGTAWVGRGFDIWDSQPIAVGDLLERMAESLHDTPLRRAATVMNLRDEVGRLAIQGTIPVRNPLDMGRVDPGPGEYLWKSVLFPRDAQRFAQEHGVTITIRPHGSGPTLWTIERAAQDICVRNGWHQGAMATLVRQMLEAARAGDLRVRHPHTDAPERDPQALAKVTGDYMLVTREDVNEWLANARAPYSWELDSDAGGDADPGSDVLAQHVRGNADKQSDTLPTRPEAPGQVTLHRIQGERRDALTPLIERAQGECKNKHDSAEVWNALVGIAQREPLPHPLIGFADGEIKYMTGDELKFLKRENLADRLRRQLRKSS